MIAGQRTGSSLIISAPGRSGRQMRRPRQILSALALRTSTDLNSCARVAFVFFQFPRGSRRIRMGKEGNRGGFWAPTEQESRPFGGSFVLCKQTDSGHVAARPGEARDQADLTGSSAMKTIGIVGVAAFAAIAADAGRDDHCYPSADQFGRQLRHPLGLTPSPAVLVDVLALDVAAPSRPWRNPANDRRRLSRRC